MRKDQKNKKARKIGRIIIYIIFFILLYSILFIHNKFGNISFEQFIYNIINTEGANYGVVFEGILFVVLRLAITFIIIFIVYIIYKSLNINIFLKIDFKNKKYKINLFSNKLLKIFCLVLFIGYTIYTTISLLNIDTYFLYQKNSSTLFEDYYVDGRNVELKFPNKKRNLIYIYLESMETSNVSIENGGFFEKSYIPKLEELALQNISFSNTDKLGGAYHIDNASWTIAALIAHTAGVPLKLSLNGKFSSNYNHLMPGTYTLGDILYENGYNNYFMIGSDAEFGGRKDYFKKHGNYTIYDYYYAIDEKLIDSDYFVWWGYEDKKLFEFAKDKILDASKEDEPFNFTLLTVDTHFTDGYMDESCEDVFDSVYANSIYCSDQKIYNFINWIKKQDFYKNTTIVITGDHLTMQNDFYDESINDKRTIYNTFINSAVDPVITNNRTFTTLDMFPTTLASLGVKIENNKLGLGVNLFSNEKTIPEIMGIEEFRTEISKKSLFYDSSLLVDSYSKEQNNSKK